VFAIRHGETEWSLSGQHTGATDIALTDNGRRVAARMRPLLVANPFRLVFCSPMRRAGETCELAGRQHFLLNTGTLSVLGYYREIPAVRIWNGPLID